MNLEKCNKAGRNAILPENLINTAGNDIWNAKIKQINPKVDYDGCQKLLEERRFFFHISRHMAKTP